MVSEGDSGSRSWSRAHLGIPGTSAPLPGPQPPPGPLLRLPLTGLVSPKIPLPGPALGLVKAKSLGGGAVSEEDRLRSPPVRIPALVPAPCSPIFPIFTSQPNPSEEHPTPIISTLAPPLHVQTLLSPPSYHSDQSVAATSPLTSLLALAVSSPPPFPAPSRTPLGCRYPGACPPHLPSPDPFLLPFFFSLSTPCLSPGVLLSH